jgi:hypothetical protein
MALAVKAIKQHGIAVATNPDTFVKDNNNIKGQQAKGPPQKKVKVRINSLLVAIEAYWNNLWLIP